MKKTVMLNIIKTPNNNNNNKKETIIIKFKIKKIKIM